MPLDVKRNVPTSSGMAELPEDDGVGESASVPSTPRVTKEKLAIGERILKLREAVGLTQEQLAERADVRAQAIWRYEHGWNKPGAETVLKLADALGTTTRFIMLGTSAATPDLVDEAIDTKGWKRFVELGLYDRYLELGLDEEQLDYVRHGRFKAGRPEGPEPYIELAELLSKEPVKKSAEEALAEARDRRKRQ